MADAGLFVTGTDTDCGKTLIAQGLLQAYADRGRRVAGLKPVAAGAIATPAGLRNDDALALQARCEPPEPYDAVNPYCFAPPIAPHIAAAEAGTRIAPEPILAARDRLAARHDLLVVEGAGGWRVPLGDDWDLADLAVLLGYPVVLVVGLRLGCLNHALLTRDAVLGRGLPLAGWVANALPGPMARVQENLEALHARMMVPCLGEIPRLAPPDPVLVAARLRLPEI